MRAFLDRFYDAAGYAAAFFMVATLLMVVAGIADRMLSLGLRGTDMYAGYSMAATGFLALAHTLKRGEHIRVTLILQAVSPKVRHVMEVAALLVSSVLSGAFAFYSVRLACQSWEFNDISTGADATPLWIPQLSMAIGAVVLFVAFIDDFVMEVAGKRTVPAGAESAHHE